MRRAAEGISTASQELQAVQRSVGTRPAGPAGKGADLPREWHL